MPVIRYGYDTNVSSLAQGYSQQRNLKKAKGKDRLAMMLTGRNRYGKQTAGAKIGKAALWTGIGIAAGVTGAATGGAAAVGIIGGATALAAGTTFAAEQQVERATRGTSIHKEIAETNAGKKAAGAGLATFASAAGGFLGAGGKVGGAANAGSKFTTPMNLSGTTPMQFGKEVAPLSHITTGVTTPSALTTPISSSIGTETVKGAGMGFADVAKLPTSTQVTAQPNPTALQKAATKYKNFKENPLSVDENSKELMKFANKQISKSFETIEDKVIASGQKGIEEALTNIVDDDDEILEEEIGKYETTQKRKPISYGPPTGKNLLLKISKKERELKQKIQNGGELSAQDKAEGWRMEESGEIHNVGKPLPLNTSIPQTPMILYNNVEEEDYSEEDAQKFINDF